MLVELDGLSCYILGHNSSCLKSQYLSCRSRLAASWQLTCTAQAGTIGKSFLHLEIWQCSVQKFGKLAV